MLQMYTCTAASRHVTDCRYCRRRSDAQSAPLHSCHRGRRWVRPPRGARAWRAAGRRHSPWGRAPLLLSRARRCDALQPRAQAIQSDTSHDGMHPYI